LIDSSFQLVTGRTWRGSAFGGVKGRTELPGLVDDYLAGKMKVDEYVTHSRTLGDINEGFHDMHVSVQLSLYLWKQLFRMFVYRVATAFAA
jgi:Zn-dependent alcohol dehydrogenase